VVDLVRHAVIARSRSVLTSATLSFNGMLVIGQVWFPRENHSWMEPSSYVCPVYTDDNNKNKMLGSVALSLLSALLRRSST
jgi:hypothetical protein